MRCIVVLARHPLLSLLCKPFSSPQPSVVVSPATTLAWQAGDCVDMSILLASVLLGADNLPHTSNGVRILWSSCGTDSYGDSWSSLEPERPTIIYIFNLLSQDGAPGFSSRPSPAGTNSPFAKIPSHTRPYPTDSTPPSYRALRNPHDSPFTIFSHLSFRPLRLHKRFILSVMFLPGSDFLFRVLCPRCNWVPAAGSGYDALCVVGSAPRAITSNDASCRDCPEHIPEEAELVRECLL